LSYHIADSFCHETGSAAGAGTGRQPRLTAPQGRAAEGSSKDKDKAGGRFQPSSSASLSVVPAYIPHVVSVPKGRAWCSLPTNMVVEDQTTLFVPPYFGDDDREGVKLESFAVAPGEVEPAVVDSASFETIRYIIGKYTSHLSDDLTDKFIHMQLVKAPAAEEVALLTPLQTLSERAIRALCDTLSLSYRQVGEVAKKVTGRPSETAANSAFFRRATLSRMPLYFVPAAATAAANATTTTTTTTTTTPSATATTTAMDAFTQYGDICTYDPAAGTGDDRAPTIPLIAFEHKFKSNSKYAFASGAAHARAVPGLNALYVKVDRSETGIYDAPGAGGAAGSAGAGRAKPAAAAAAAATEGAAAPVPVPNHSSYASFFEQNEIIFAQKNIDSARLMGVAGAVASAFDSLAESFQLVYCRR
jgi:hypothetical protein